MKNTVTESTKEIPVVRDVDVVVAGGGVSGLFAALGAAKAGASVLLVERFGALGGNMGTPGMTMYGGNAASVERAGYSGGEYEAFATAMTADYAVRVREVLGSSQNYPEVSHANSYAAMQMADEYGVELMLSAYAGGPFMEGDTVKGLFVETKSGRVAVTAKVVIDGTGDASIAAAAGAPMITEQRFENMDFPSIGESYRKPDYKNFNDTGLMYIVTGTDQEKFDTWRWEVAESEWGPGDREWFDDNLEEEYCKGWKALAPALRKADEAGSFTFTKEIRHHFHSEIMKLFEDLSPDTLSGVCTITGDYNTGDWKDISLAEAQARKHITEFVCFMRENAPGFENISLIAVASFLGARGGPHIDGKFLLSVEDGFKSIRHPDTMFISHQEVHRGATEPGHDTPYGMLLPKSVKGLLVTARGASYIRRGHDPSFRGRIQMMAFGEAAGIAAAMSVDENIDPADLDVKKLQKVLLEEDFYLGEDERLKELGLL
jgi:hypothetical protein